MSVLAKLPFQNPDDSLPFAFPDIVLFLVPAPHGLFCITPGPGSYRLGFLIVLLYYVSGPGILILR